MYRSTLSPTKHTSKIINRFDTEPVFIFAIILRQTTEKEHLYQTISEFGLVDSVVKIFTAYGHIPIMLPQAGLLIITKTMILLSFV